MEQYWREVVGSGERVLIELKSGSKEHSLLSDAVARMKSCWDGKGKGARGSDGVDGDGGTQQSSPNRAEVAHPPCSAESMKAIGKFALSVDDVSRLAYSCRLALSPDGVGVYKNPSKGLAAALELAANVLNSGLVPATLLAALPVYDPQKQTTGSPFFSRLWITSKKSKQSECAPQTGENVLEGAESATHDMRALLVDAILEVADYILAKESSEKLVFVLVAALQACCAPTVSRQSVTQMVDNRQTVARLSVHNDRLVKAFQLLCHIYVKPVILGDLATRAKTALKDVAKCLVTNMELERCESLGDSRVLGSSSPITTSVVSDFVHVMRFCSSIILCAPMVVAGGGGSQSMGSPNSCELGDPSSLGSLSNFLSKDALLVCSLGIMLHLTVNGGPVFRNSEAILECVRHVVIPAAIKGTVSCTIDVFRLSLSVLQTCYSQLGALLVNEVSTIFRHVYFRVLHSTLTTYSHKALVIEAFEKYIEEPRNMISLFINYDCDTRSQSIFEEMVHYLAAFAAPESLKKTLEVTSANSFSPSMTGTASGSKKTAEDLSNGSSLHGSFQAMALPPSFISVRLGYAIPESLRRKSLLALLSLVDSSIQWIDRFESSAVMIERVPPQHEETIEAAYDKGEHDDSEATEREPTHPSPTMFQRETFIQTKRYKDAFKKFLYIFNTKSSPRTALEYFQTNVDLQREFGSSSTCRSEGSSDHEANDGSNPVTAHATAVFLKAREEYIDKTILGEFFAKCFERAEWRTVLEEWVHLHDFRNLALDEAVRLFLGGFKLLGEAQVVDRTMELFAAEYCRQNPNVFSSADTAFILSFSICMLNTDAHSPHVKEKMTLDGFLRNNRSIDEGNDVDVDILSGIYTRITQKEIVLRPSPGCSNCGKGQWNQVPLTETHAPTGLLNSVPILRYLAPTATPRTATTESALLPESVENGFGPKRQKWEAAYQAELQKVLEEVTVALQQHLTTPPSEGDNPSPVVNASAANVECTLPMWEITVDVLRPILVASLAQFFCEAESFSPPSDGGASNSANKTITAACDLYLAENGNKDYFWRLLSGVDKVVRVCRTFGGADHVEILLEQLFQLSEVSQSVIIESSSRAGKVTVLKTMSRPRIDLLCTFLDLFMSYGDLLSSRGWHVGYTVVSLLDALANGMEGMFARQTRKYLEESNSSKSTTLSSARPDLWFGDLHDAPSCMSRESVERRRKILSGIRSSRSTMVDIWLERFFDATRYPASTRVRMTNGLAKVCHRELKNCRSFSTLKLFDFVTIGVNDFTRLQWRDVWLNASEVFITAGKAVAQLSHAALDGLRYVALMYIMREELLNYSFQKAVLMPFLEILESQSDTTIRRRVVEILSELIELRAEHLASGWGVVFRSLEAAARMPEVVSDAWAVTERIMTSHLGFIKDYFGDLIRCITAFSSSTDICVSQHAISYMVACGKWLRWGLLSPPPLGTAGDVLTWSRSTATLEEADIRKVPHVVVETVTIPDSSASKTGGSLWMALFDGLVPQTQLHGSLAVRAHATHAFFVLIQTHGDCFDGSVIDHLGQMIQRLLHSILDSIAEGEGAHRVSNPQVPAEEWCLLLCVALQSLLCSCVAVPQLTNSVVTAMESLCERCQTIFLIRHNVVDVMVRSCIDFIVATATDVYLTGDETCNRLLLMAVDNHRKHFGRFAAAADDPQWEELRSCNPACCIPEPIHFGENPDQISSVQKMVTRCLSDILLPQVFHWIQPGQVSHTCEANTQIVRSFCFVLLGVGVHAVATHEFDGCKGIVRIFEELQQECVALHEVMPEAQATQKSRMPIEALLIIPWMCCVMEYVGGLVQQSFPRWNEMAQVMTRRYMVFIRESQKWCAAEAPTVSFEDFFHTALSVDAPESLCSEPLTEANVRRYLQRSYLVHVIGLRWSWSCGETSLMARSADLQLFLNTIPALPSTMEERSLNPLYEHCCEVLCMPTELLDNSTETLLACVGFCDHKLNQGGRMSGGSSSIG